MFLGGNFIGVEDCPDDERNCATTSKMQILE
jgi:hypothetical protein